MIDADFEECWSVLGEIFLKVQGNELMLPRVTYFDVITMHTNAKVQHNLPICTYQTY